MLADTQLFLKQFLRDRRSTGAIAPSSRWLAEALTRYVSAAALRPRLLLEVGAGTGAVTRQLVRCMAPTDQLDIVELNPAFTSHLRHRFDCDPLFMPVATRVRVIEERIEWLSSERKYDCIVSGLPLNNFTEHDVERILQTFARLLAPGGKISFFEYVAVRPMRALVTNREGRARLKGIGRMLGRWLNDHEVRREVVWPNIPPACVHHVQLEPITADGNGAVDSEPNGASALNGVRRAIQA